MFYWLKLDMFGQKVIVYWLIGWYKHILLVQLTYVNRTIAIAQQDSETNAFFKSVSYEELTNITTSIYAC